MKVPVYKTSITLVHEIKARKIQLKLKMLEFNINLDDKLQSTLNIHLDCYSLNVKCTTPLPVDMWVWILGSQMLVLFEKNMRPLGGEASAEEVRHWEKALRFDSPAIAFLHSEH